MTKVLKPNLFCLVIIIAAFAMIGKGPTASVCVRHNTGGTGVASRTGTLRRNFEEDIKAVVRGATPWHPVSINLSIFNYLPCKNQQSLLHQN